MKGSLLIKLALIAILGASTIVPLQRLQAWRNRPPVGGAAAPAAEPAREKEKAGAAPSDATTAAPAGTAAPHAVSAPPPAAPARRTYVVREGDNLWTIAEKELGDGRLWERIAEANRGRLDLNNLKVGQVLVIPNVNADAPRHR
jgi:nucleoid-associated protein YgaU